MRRIFIFIICLFTFVVFEKIQAQTSNSMTETIPFRMVDGKIILKVTVNGEPSDFVLDLAGHNSVLSEEVENLHINTQEKSSFGSYYQFVFKDIPVDSNVYKIGTLTCGNNVFGNDLPVFILKDEPYLRQLGAKGILSSAIFRNSVLTIDVKRRLLTVTQPYRPSYMKLNYRQNFDLITGLGTLCSVSIQGKTLPLVFDTWNENIINLTTKDYTEWSDLCQKGSVQMTSQGYKKPTENGECLEIPELSFIKTKISNVCAVKNTSLKHSVLGSGILEHGIISIDYIHQKIYFQPFDLVPIPSTETTVGKVTVEDGILNPISRQFFLEHIFDYRKDNDFIYNGDKPIVIDFWARWCGPCMRLLPEMEKIAEKYKGKVIFYKVNADKEKDLCNYLKVQALPTLYFIPNGGEPIVEIGATPEKVIEIIEKKLLK